MATKKETTVNLNEFKFGKNGLITVVTQDYESGEVLLVGAMNKEAVEKTFETGYAHYYSAEKKEVLKFASSQRVRVAFLDNDGKNLLLKVELNVKDYHLFLYNFWVYP
jgi:phosphoribosyl-AMP cyclohydrolase